MEKLKLLELKKLAREHKVGIKNVNKLNKSELVSALSKTHRLLKDGTLKPRAKFSKLKGGTITQPTETQTIDHEQADILTTPGHARPQIPRNEHARWYVNVIPTATQELREATGWRERGEPSVVQARPGVNRIPTHLETHGYSNYTPYNTHEQEARTEGFQEYLRDAQHQRSVTNRLRANPELVNDLRSQYGTQALINAANNYNINPNAWIPGDPDPEADDDDDDHLMGMDEEEAAPGFYNPMQGGALGNHIKSLESIRERLRNILKKHKTGSRAKRPAKKTAGISREQAAEMLKNL